MTLHVSAGGRGERISGYIATISPELPKHLLPIPTDGGTILGEIVLSGQQRFREVRVWASSQTYPHISLALGTASSVRVCIDGDMTGPLGPMVRNALTTKVRTYACAGDFYCPFDWGSFEHFHDESERPISILVARSVPTSQGARFVLDSSGVTRWERVETTSSEDLINMGCYIIDPTPEVVSLLESLGRHKEDPFFDAAISKGLVSGYNPGVSGFNVNIGEVYQCLLMELSRTECT